MLIPLNGLVIISHLLCTQANVTVRQSSSVRVECILKHKLFSVYYSDHPPTTLYDDLPDKLHDLSLWEPQASNVKGQWKGHCKQCVRKWMYSHGPSILT